MSDTSHAALVAARTSHKNTTDDILAFISTSRKPRQPREPVERFAFNVRDACTAIGVGRTSLYEMAKRGEIKFMKIAGRTVVPRSEIERITTVYSEAA